MTRIQSNKLIQQFEWMHNNPPRPFNPLARTDPAYHHAYAQVPLQMAAEGFYDSHTREECAIELRKRRDALG